MEASRQNWEATPCHCSIVLKRIAMTHDCLHREMKYHISPNFTHEKLDDPTFTDLVDVFEDRMTNWLIEPAHQLLSVEHGSIAAVAVLLGYFEGIEIYCSGQDSYKQSGVFFHRGFQRVFTASAAEPKMLFPAITDTLYTAVRCGFAHDALFRKKVFFSTIRKDAFTVTWPKKNGVFDMHGKLESVVINPPRFCECIRIHFGEYIRTLRAEQDEQLKANFLAVIRLKWGLNEPAPFVGMSENDFLRGA